MKIITKILSNYCSYIFPIIFNLLGISIIGWAVLLLIDIDGIPKKVIHKLISTITE